jgi:CubicO group peptidase (beta-lactamase class C family)
MRKVAVAVVVAAVACGAPPRPVTTASSAPSASASAAPSTASVDITGDWDVRWDRGFAGWQPTIFDGKLSLHRVGDAWSGDLSFNQSQARFTFLSAQVDGDRFDLRFLADSTEGKGDAEIRGVAHDGRLLAEMRLGQSIDWNPFGAHRHGATPAPAGSPPDAARTPPVNIAGDWDVRWDRGFTGWKPTIFEGKLSLQRSGDGWSGAIAFRQSQSRRTLKSAQIDGDRFDLRFDVEDPDGTKGDYEVWGVVREGRLFGEAHSNNIDWTPFGGHAHVVPRLQPHAVDHSLPSFDIATTGVDRAALQDLVTKAAEERSSALVLLVDGKVGLETYLEGYDGSPIVAMSASKSITSLAVGMLVAEGKLSLDTRMGALFPEWKKQGNKAAITVRQLLTQTSGLEPSRADFQHDETIRAHVSAAKLLWPPGSRFQYNNGAVDFLAVVLRQAAGVPLDEYLETHLFQKMDIVGASWMKDAEGTPRAAGELVIRPVDLAKLGQLMLDGGVWQGTRLLPADWVKQSVAAGQHYDESCGLLWWREGKFAFVVSEPLLASWQDVGVDAKMLLPVRALIGHKYDWDGYRGAIEKAVGADGLKAIQSTIEKGDHVPFAGKVTDGPVRGFSARGWLGQYLVVLTGPRVVAVRMRAWEPSDEQGGEERNAFPRFPYEVAKLFRSVE